MGGILGSPPAWPAGDHRARSAALKPMITGFALSIVLIGIIFTVPAFLPGSAKPETVKALREAELARRQLTAFDATMPLTAVRSDLELLKQADVDRLAERTAEDFAEVQNEFNRRIQSAKSLDRRSGLGESNLRAITPGTSAVSGFEQAVRANEQLLAAAVRNAKSASQTDQSALSVGQIAGTAKLVEADHVLSAARPLRTALAEESNRLLAIAVRLAGFQALDAHYAGLDLTDVAQSLADDLTETNAKIESSSQELQTVEGTIANLRREIESVQSLMRRKQDALLSLEHAGFEAGNSASFESYRATYLALSREIDELQTREHLLLHGGIMGGTIADDDLLAGDITGGEAAIGVDELEHKAALLRTKLGRLQKARESLDAQRALVSGLTSDSQSRRVSCGDKLRAAKVEFDQVRERIEELAQRAFEQEENALRAAREAATGFKAAKSAANQWKNNAGSVQRDHDAQKVNERLKLIISDEHAVAAADSGEAQALTLAGRILTERALALQGRANVAARITELIPDAVLDLPALRESFTQARDDAILTLNSARELYEQLSQRQASAAWIHKSSLSTVYSLLAQIDEAGARQHRGNMMSLLNEVVAGRQQYPYLKQQALLLSAIGGNVPAPAPLPSVQPSEPAPTEAPESEG